MVKPNNLKYILLNIKRTTVIM